MWEAFLFFNNKNNFILNQEGSGSFMLNSEGLKREIREKNIYVDNVEDKIGENFIYVTLGDTLKVYDTPVLDVKEPSATKQIKIPEEGLVLEPNKLYLGRTNEYTKTYGYVPLLSGLPELASIGMEIHITAGFGDNGFEGTWTLEIICANPTRVYPNIPIGKIYYYPLVGDSSIEYRGKYFGQVEPTESRIAAEYKLALTRKEGDKDVNK